MTFGEISDDIVKNWVILFGLLIHWIDYLTIPHAQLTPTLVSYLSI